MFVCPSGQTFGKNPSSMTNITKMGSSVLNPGAMFLRFITEAFLLFLAPAGGSNPAGPGTIINSKLT